MNRRSLSVDPGKVPRSCRAYLGLLAERGELLTIEDEVDWYLEIGAILRYACEHEQPMPLFSRVKDAPDFRAAEMGPTPSAQPGRRWQRLALMLGLPEDATLMEIQVGAWRPPPRRRPAVFLPFHSFFGSPP